MSDTPRTDAALREDNEGVGPQYLTNLARQLERELVAAKSQAGKTYEQVDLETREELAACQAELKAAQEELESHAWGISPSMAQAKIDELNVKLELYKSIKCGDNDSIGGCGKEIRILDAYRCADCGAYFHKDCLREHCETSSYITAIRQNKELIDGWKKDVAEAKQQLQSANEQLAVMTTERNSYKINASVWEQRAEKAEAERDKVHFIIRTMIDKGAHYLPKQKAVIDAAIAEGEKKA